MTRSLAAGLLSVILLAGAGCAGTRTQPVHDVHDHPMPAPALGLSRDQIGVEIAQATSGARWHLDAVEPGQMWATIEWLRSIATRSRAAKCWPSRVR